jgi:hypothetical protein
LALDLCTPCGAHQLLVYADDVNILGGSVYTIKENAEALVMASKEIGLEVKHLGTTLMDQNSVQEEIKEQIEVRECLLSLDTEFLVF